MKTKKKIFVRIAAALLLLLFTGFVIYLHGDFWIFDTALGILNHGYAKALPYKMLSGDLKALVSEEEYLDVSPEGRLNLYRKVGERIFVDEKHLHGSTDQYKTPQANWDCFIIGEKRYIVQYEVDFAFTVLGLFRPKAVNFRAIYISESDFSESSE